MKQRDPRTNDVLLTGFGAQSRRYNALFSLAVHEVQASNDEKEVRIHSPYTPANIRIHGTMYRRVLSAAESNPVRYLVVDPSERLKVATAHGLDQKVVDQLEKTLLAHNPNMQPFGN